MTRSLILGWTVLALTCTPAHAQQEVSSDDPRRIANLYRVLESCPELVTLLRDPAWVESIANPTISTRAQLDAVLQRTAVIHEFLDSLDVIVRSQRYLLPSELPAGLRFINDQATHFVVIASRARDAGRIVDLAGREVGVARLGDGNFVDLVRVLREDIGVASPGGYVFVALYASRDELPPSLRGAFADEQTAAVFFGCRCVVVLEEAHQTPYWEGASSMSLELTISQALARVYLRSAVGPSALDSLSGWFQRGLSLYLSRRHTRWYESVSLKWGAVLNVSYRIPTGAESEVRLFSYLERRLGRERFRKVIRKCVEDRTSHEVLAATGAADYASLLAQMQKDARIWLGVWVTSGAVVVLGLGIFHRVELARDRKRRTARFARAALAAREVALEHPRERTPGDGGLLGARFQVAVNYGEGPFRRVHFRLSSCPAKGGYLVICDSSGRVVRELRVATRDRWVTWDKNNSAGCSVGVGMYTAVVFLSEAPVASVRVLVVVGQTLTQKL